MLKKNGSIRFQFLYGAIKSIKEAIEAVDET